MQGRGLKQIKVYFYGLGVLVAPHAGAWIETVLGRFCSTTW